MDLISEAADIMLSEAQHMEAAAKRFEARRNTHRPTAKASR